MPDTRRQSFLGYDAADGDTVETVRWHRLAVPFYGALCALEDGQTAEAGPEVDPSPATCKQLPTPDDSGRSWKPDLSDPVLRETAADLLRLGIEDVDEAARLAPDAVGRVSALYDADGWRREAALELLRHGEAAHAESLASCGAHSVQLECPDEFGAGGCGCSDNFVPISCNSPLCPDCADSRIGRAVEKYGAWAYTAENLRFLTLNIPNVDDPAHGEQLIKDYFGKFRRRTIPTEGTSPRGKPWKWWRDGGEPSYRWRPHLDDETARSWHSRFYETGRNVPMDEIIRGGFYSIDVKQADDGTYNVHLHALVDMHHVPHPALEAVWSDVIGAEAGAVVDVRSVYDRDGHDHESAVLETVAYAVKPPNFESVESEVQYAVDTKGSRMVQPFGSLYGSAPDVSASLLCSNCEREPNWWNYRGTVNQAYDNMEVQHTAGENDPPDS